MRRARRARRCVRRLSCLALLGGPLDRHIRGDSLGIGVRLRKVLRQLRGLGLGCKPKRLPGLRSGDGNFGVLLACQKQARKCRAKALSVKAMDKHSKSMPHTTKTANALNFQFVIINNNNQEKGNSCGLGGRAVPVCRLPCNAAGAAGRSTALASEPRIAAEASLEFSGSWTLFFVGRTSARKLA